MYPVQWDVTSYQYRAGQIRIVDAATANWGHINVDQIELSWDTRGGRLPSSGEKVRSWGEEGFLLLLTHDTRMKVIWSSMSMMLSQS
jgi:hypothetical protein